MTEHTIERAVESTGAKLVSRWIVPAMVALIGFFMHRTLDKIEVKQDEQGRSITQIQTAQMVMNTRLDERVIRQVDLNTAAITDLKKRVDELEKRR